MITFGDSTNPIDDFIMFQGDDAYLEITIKDKATKADKDISSYADAVWELEGIEFRIEKSITGGQIQRVTTSTLRIPLNDTDTEALRGLYTHQLRLIDSNGAKTIVLNGKGRFDAEVFNSAA